MAFSLARLRSLFRLLLLSQGIHPNPGPHPCTVCATPVTYRGYSFLCSRCAAWTHKRCSGLNSIHQYTADWVCPACRTAAPAHIPVPLPDPPSLAPAYAFPPPCILQLNCNGVQSTAVELATFLSKHNVAVACLQESKLTAASRPPLFSGYAVERRDRPGGRGGGLLTLVRHDVHYSNLDTSTLFNGDITIETQGITASLNGAPLKIINLYIPPATSCPPGYIPNLAAILAITDDCLIVGDFNAHHASWYSHTEDQRAAARGVVLDDYLSTSSFGILNEDSPTRLPTHGPASSPDLSLISAHLLLETSWSTHVALNSDHLPILISLPQPAPTAPHRTARTYVNFRKANWLSFTAEVEDALEGLPAPTSCGDEGILRGILTAAAKHNIPAGFHKDFAPVINPGTSDLIAQRDDIRQQDPQDPRLPILNLDIAASLQAHARETWRAHLASCDRRTHPSKHWNLLRSLAGKRSRPPPNQPILFNGKLYTSQRKISTAFCKQFTSVVPYAHSPATRRLARQIRSRHPLDRNFLPFSVQLVKLAIGAASNSTASGPDGLTVLHLKHLGPRGLEFLTHLFNISVSTASIPAIWKNSLIIPIAKPGKPKDQGSSYRPISLLCPAVKILERLLLPHLTASLSTSSSQHGFKPGHSTVTALLPLSHQIATGLNSRRPPARTVAAAIDLSKAFDSVDHPLLLSMISESTLHHNLVRWLCSYLKGRLASCLYLRTQSPFKSIHTGVPQGSVISPSLFNYFISDCPVPPSNIASYADDLTIFVASPRLNVAEEDLAVLLSGISEWSTAKKLAIAPDKSSVTLFTSDTHQSRIHPTASIGNSRIPLDKTPKILGVTWDTHFTFSPHVKATANKASTTLRILKALAGTSWGLSKEDIIATYKTITRPILNYAAPIWYPLASRSAVASLQVIQNSALRLATGCLKMASIDHLHIETGVLPLSAHLDLACSQFLVSALQPNHPSFQYVAAAPGERPMKPTLQSRFGYLVAPLLVDGRLPAGSYGDAKRTLRREIASRTAELAENNRVLAAPPPSIAPEEATLPRPFRATLAQLRSGFCNHLASYSFRVGRSPSAACPECGDPLHSTQHLFSCPSFPTDLPVTSLWDSPVRAATFLASLPSFAHLPPLPVALPRPPPEPPPRRA